MIATKTAPWGCLEHELEHVYREKAKTHLTSHMLADYRRCPALYLKKRMGLIPDDDRPAYFLGRALHTLVLEGRDRFEDTYVVGGPVNPRTGRFFGADTKAFAEWAEAQGKPVLTVEQFELLENMADGVRQQGIARDLLSEGVAEGVVRCDYCGVPSQSRLDWVDPHRAVADLKTCDELTWFEADAKRYGYAHQMAFYRAMLAQRIGIQMPVYLIAIEKREPYRCGVWQMSADVLAYAQKENEAAIERLKRSLVTDTWPTGYEECRLFDSL